MGQAYLVMITTLGVHDLILFNVYHTRSEVFAV